MPVVTVSLSADHLQIGEVNDRVAAGMRPSEVMQFDCDAAELERILRARISNAGRRGFRILHVSDEILVEIFVRDDLHSRIQKPLVVAGVIGMVMSHDEVLDRLIRSTLDQRHQSVVVRLAGKFSVDQDDSLVGDAEGRIAARAGDHVEPGLDLLDGLGLRARPPPRWSMRRNRGESRQNRDELTEFS